MAGLVWFSSVIFRCNGSERYRQIVLCFLGLLALLTVGETINAETTSKTPQGQGMIVIDNQTGYAVDVLYYNDATGSYTPFRHLSVGETLNEAVKSGSTWFFRVNGEAFIGKYMTTDESDQLLVLEATMLEGVGYPLPEARRAVSSTGVIGSTKPSPLPEVSFKSPPKNLPEKNAIPPQEEMLAEATPVPELLKWYEGPDDAVAIFSKDAKLVDVSDDNRFSLIKSTPDNTAKTTSVWFTKAIPGTNVHHLRNVHFLDRYVYIDQHAQDGWIPRFGPEGKSLPTARWRVKKGVYFTEIINDARPDLRLAVRNDSLVLSNKNYDSTEQSQRDSVAHQDGGAWALFDIKSFRELMSLKDGFVKMAENVEELERKEAERLAGIERKKQETTTAEAKRRAIARVPELLHGDSKQVVMRLGVGDIATNEHGSKLIEYSYAAPGFKPYLKANLGTSTLANNNQSVELMLEPKITAWVHKGKLYVRLQTPNNTRIDMRRGNKPSTDYPTDGNFYIAHVKMNAQFDYGREIHLSPIAENERTDAGTNQDTSRGLNFNIEEGVGADISESKGSSANFSALDYRVSGQRGPAEVAFVGSAQYDWHGCGLAVTVKSITNCTYEAPTDMYDPETQSLRQIKTIAHAMPGLETDTVFRVDYPNKQGLSDRLTLRLVVSTQLHMAKILPTTKENTKNKDWNDFVAGFTYVFRPDTWDFNKSFNNQKIIREALYKSVGFTQDEMFEYFLYIHIEDLKQFMD